MAINLTHTQCRLRNGVLYCNTWLPTKFAKIGKVLSLKMDNGKWMDGWVVQETWAVKSSVDVIEAERFWRSHRDGTDAYREKGENKKPGRWKTPHGRKLQKRNT